MYSRGAAERRWARTRSRSPRRVISTSSALTAGMGATRTSASVASLTLTGIRWAPASPGPISWAPSGPEPRPGAPADRSLAAVRVMFEALLSVHPVGSLDQFTGSVHWIGSLDPFHWFDGVSTPRRT